MAWRANVVGTYSRPLVLMEHGAGQSYSNRQPSFPGGTERETAALLLVPNDQARARNLQYYPGIPCAVVGCPKLDVWPMRGPWTPASGRRPVVCVSFHWHTTVCPESDWAWHEYREALRGLVGQEWDIIGHAHPRAQSTVFPEYRRQGIPTVAGFAEVLQRADLYVIDNSSTLFEFAATDRPVVVLNSKFYRRGVEHGLRFWAAADIGLQVNRPDELVATVRQALADPPAQATTRRARVAEIYPFRGDAAARAVDAIMREPACWRARVEVTAMTSSHGLIDMQANYEVNYRGTTIPAGGRFRVPDNEARRLEGSYRPNRRTPLASRVGQTAPAPTVTSAPPGDAPVAPLAETQVAPTPEVAVAPVAPVTPAAAPVALSGVVEVDPTVCTVCGKTGFTKKNALRAHMLSHRTATTGLQAAHT